MLRVVTGDIGSARASLLVVGHLNGLRPDGAEAALDAALGGAIARRADAGALDGPLGAAQFVPVASAPVGADAALVVSLGDPGRFDPGRLPELGSAIVDAACAVRARDVATVVHGAGILRLPLGECAGRLADGLLAALARAEGEHELREVQLVVRSPADARAVHRALARATRPRGLAVAVEQGTTVLTAPPRAGAAAPDGEPASRVHVAITRVGDRLKVTLITDGAFDPARSAPYPVDVAARVLVEVDDRVLRGATQRDRLAAMRRVGEQLHAAFVAGRDADVEGALRRVPGACVLLRLDESTVDLPWELLRVGRRTLGLDWRLARQREITDVGHPAAYVPRHARLRALVVGDPTGDLPGAAAEAEAVAATLTGLGASVVRLGTGTRRADVLAAIDAADPDVLHHAGHAAFDVLRQQSGGLVLADGCLTADDLAARPRLPRLFVANGCQAAKTGDVPDQRLSDGAAPTHDFAGGVLRAGARALVGAQWVVGDAAARTFAEAFHRAIAAPEPAPVGDAVDAGRRAVIAAHGRAEPAWAAYVLYGAPWKPAL